MRRIAQVTLVWTLVVLLSFDTALACRFFALRQAYCRPAYTYCEPVPVSCCEVVYSTCDTVVGGHYATEGTQSGGYEQMRRPSDEMPPPPMDEESEQRIRM